MKKLVSFLLAVCLCLSFGLTLTACGENHDETVAEVRDEILRRILKIIGFFVFLFRSGLLERSGRNVIFILESSRKNVNRGITEFVRDFGYGHVALAQNFLGDGEFFVDYVRGNRFAYGLFEAPRQIRVIVAENVRKFRHVFKRVDMSVDVVYDVEAEQLRAVCLRSAQVYQRYRNNRSRLG